VRIEAPAFGDQPGPDGIQVDVVENPEEIRTLPMLDDHRLVAAAGQVAPLPVPAVEAPGAGVLEPAHPGDQIAFRGLEQQVNSAEGL